MPGFPADDSGPLIEVADNGAALLSDSQLGAPWWAPAPELVPAAEGTFRFLFRVTGHDDDGSPTIAAAVTAALRFPPPGRPDARPVTRTGLAVRLRIPFVNADTGAATATELPAEASEQDGVIRCRAEITGAVARAAYGALSTPGFQPNDQAGLVVETSFTAVQEAPFAWATKVVKGAGHDGQDAVLVLAPVRGWPYEEPPRVEHPVPDDHPNWGDVITSQVTVPDASQSTALQAPTVIEVPSPFLEQPAATLTLTEEPLALPAAAGKLLGGGELRGGAAAGAALPRRDGGLDPGPDDGQDPDGSSPQPTQPMTFMMAVTVNRQHRVPLLVPCRDHPELYRQDLGDGTPPAVIGCQEAFQLGRVSPRRFDPLPRLDLEHRYAVWESLQQPATYLVVPAHYRVARAPTTGQPEFQWLQVFDATVDAALPCLLQARCVPDLTVAELADLQARMRAEAGGREVRVLLPTSPAVGSTGATVRDSTLSGTLRAVLDDDAVRVALRVDYADAVVVASQLRGGEAVAQVAFETGDTQLALATTVHLDVAELAGPYPDGPVQVTATGLRNDADTAATVTGLRVPSPLGGLGQRVPVQPPAHVPAQGEAALPAPPPAGAVAEAQLDPADPAALVVRNVYLENLHTVVLIRGDVDLRAKGVMSAGLTFTVSGVEVVRAVLPAGTPTLEVTLVQPLVADRPAFDRKVTISVTFTAADGSTRPAGPGPVTVDLSAGAIVRLSQLIRPLPEPHASQASPLVAGLAGAAGVRTRCAGWSTGSAGRTCRPTPGGRTRRRHRRRCPRPWTRSWASWSNSR
jgi:hypothetical protein